MQTQGGADAEVAVTSPERKFHHRFKVDWDRDGSYDHALTDLSRYVSSARTDRNLTGSAPQSLTLVEGAAAAELVITLGGDYNTDYSVADIFSPYQVNSPFWGIDLVGVECTFEIGLETSDSLIWYPQFVGNIRSITPNRGDFQVEIRALDRAELLRRPISFPKWALMLFQSEFEGETVSQLCDSAWVIDHCLRKSDISPTPSRPMTTEEQGLPDNDPTRCQIWVTGTGSYLPTIGWLDNNTTFRFPEDDADQEMYTPYGAQHPSNPDADKFPQSFGGVGDGSGNVSYYWANDKDRIHSQGTQLIGFTLITNPDAQGSAYYLTCPDQVVVRQEFGDQYWAEIWIGDSGKVWGRWGDTRGGVSFDTSHVTIPSGQDYVKIDFVVDAFHASGLHAWLGAGSNSTGSGWSTLTTARTWSSFQWDYKGYMYLSRRMPLNDIYYTATNFGGGSNPLIWAPQYGSVPASYAAVLDSGMNRLSYIPVVEAVDAWQLISDVAGAEFGSVFWDENGVFRFWNYGTIQMLQNAPVRVVNLDQLTGLQFTDWADSIRNIITVQATDRRSDDSLEGVMLYQNQSEFDFYIPGGTRKTWTINVSDMQTQSPESPPRYETPNPGSALPQWSDSVVHGYVVQWLHNDGLWYEDAGMSSGIDIDQWMDYEGNLVITIYNGYLEPARLWTDTGQPGLRISGTKLWGITEKTYTYKDVSSVQKYGGRNLLLNTPWHQEFHNQMGGITQLLNVTKDPVPDTENITLAGDPRIQLGDTFRVTDPEGFGTRFDMQIFGINRTYDVASGLTDTYAVKLIKTPGGIWDDAQYGRWDQTFIWGN